METMAREVARRLIRKEWGIRYIDIPKIRFAEGVRTEHTRKDKRGHRVPVFQPYRVGTTTLTFDKAISGTALNDAYPHLVRGIAEYAARKIVYVTSEKVTPEITQKDIDHAAKLISLWSAPRDGDAGLVVLSNGKTLSVNEFEKLDKATASNGRLASRVRVSGKRSTFFYKPEEPTPEEPCKRIVNEDEEDDTCILYAATPVKPHRNLERKKKSVSWFGIWQHLVTSVLDRCLPEEPMPKVRESTDEEDDTCVLYQGKDNSDRVILNKATLNGIYSVTRALALEEKKREGKLSKEMKKRITMETRLRRAVRERLEDDMFLADIKELPKIITEIAPNVIAKRYRRKSVY